MEVAEHQGAVYKPTVQLAISHTGTHNTHTHTHTVYTYKKHCTYNMSTLINVYMDHRPTHPTHTELKDAHTLKVRKWYETKKKRIDCQVGGWLDR